MAMAVMAMMTMMIMVVLLLFVVMLVEVLPVAAQAAPESPPPVPEPITCSLPNTSMISPNYCNAYDEKRMSTQTQSCEGFLTDSEAAPSKDCCTGLNSVAFNRTACICKFTFYPPAQHDAARQLDLPRLCGVVANLCGQCPTFLVSRSNGTAPTTPIADHAPFSEGKSTASTVGAISLAVVFGVLLVVGIAAFSIMLIKRRKAKTNPPQAFEAPPPGGAF